MLSALSIFEDLSYSSTLSQKNVIKKFKLLSASMQKGYISRASSLIRDINLTHTLFSDLTTSFDLI